MRRGQRAQQRPREPHPGEVSGRTPGRNYYRDFAAPVTVVCGPPGAGKSRYIRERAEPGDLVVDLDMIFSALGGGLPMHSDHPRHLLPFAMEARAAVVERLRQPSDVRRAWIPTMGASHEERQRYRDAGAEVVVLDVPVAVCLARIAADQERDNRGDHELYERLVTKWWTEYQAK